MRFDSRARWTAFCVVVAGAAVIAAVALAVRGPLPAIGVVVLFGAMLAFASHQEIILPNGVGKDSSLMVLTAAVFVFAPNAYLLGPLLVGMFAGLYLPQIRAREWRKIIGNFGVGALSVLPAAAMYGVLRQQLGDTPPALLLAAIPVTLVLVVATDLLVSIGSALQTGRPPAALLRELATGTLFAYPFCIFGFFLGQLYLSFGIVVVPLFFVPIVVARETFAAYTALRGSHDDTVRILIGALEAKDQYTAGHAERVAMFANYIGLELDLSARRLERLRLAALMHDVGKLVVPNHLLNKPGRLTESEFAQVRLHETVSMEILTRIDFLAPVAPSALSEFTRFTPVADEKGQPIEPHIVAVADAFDAMTSTRSYRKALSQQTAFMELRENAGKQFHPRVVDALIVAIERRGEHYGEGHEVDVHEFEIEPPKAGLGSAGLGDLLVEDSGPPEVSAP